MNEPKRAPIFWAKGSFRSLVCSPMGDTALRTSRPSTSWSRFNRIPDLHWFRCSHVRWWDNGLVNFRRFCQDVGLASWVEKSFDVHSVPRLKCPPGRSNQFVKHILNVPLQRFWSHRNTTVFNVKESGMITFWVVHWHLRWCRVCRPNLKLIITLHDQEYV